MNRTELHAVEVWPGILQFRNTRNGTVVTVDDRQTSSADDASSALTSDASDRATAQRTFNMAIVVSGIRCTLAYVVLPFIAPLIGLAPGVGPVLGIAIAVVAIIANVVSLRRFWAVQHPWRRAMTVLHVSVIAFMVVLIVNDLSALASV